MPDTPVLDPLERDAPAAAGVSKPAPVKPAFTKRAFIRTYGCQMNVYDSERMAEALAAKGYAATDDQTEADLVLLNTCHIRERAAEKVYSELGRLREMKEEAKAGGRDVLIGVTGCVAQAEGEEIVRRAPTVDLVVGPQSYHRLGAVIDAAAKGPVVETEFPVEDKFKSLPKRPVVRKGASAKTAFLTIQEGCDKFCAFCVVPYTRGGEYSRPVADVVAEAEALAAGGVREITLLGQNVNAYHGEGPGGGEWGLGRLLFRLAELPGVARLRYTTSHPRDMDDALLAAHRDLPQVMPYLHLPVQSGSDRVLKAMNRRHTAADYHALVARIRKARPDIALSSDFIVGFPGETEAEFEETLRLAREVAYAQAFSFKYSTRPGTPAADADDQVPEDVKAERLARLNAQLTQDQIAFGRSCVGRTLDVLIEKPGRHAGQMIARSPYLQSVVIEASPDLAGLIRPASIERAGPNSLVGRLAPGRDV